MADKNEIKDRVVNTLGTAADKTMAIAAGAADKAKSVTRIAKLSMEIGREKDAMKKAYIEIGKLYYETHRDDPDGFFVQLCDEITLASENVAAKEAEIEELKASIRTPFDNRNVENISKDEEDDFASVVDGEACCCEDGEPCCCEEEPQEKCDCGCEDADVEIEITVEKDGDENNEAE